MKHEQSTHSLVSLPLSDQCRMLATDSICYDHIFKIILVGDNGVGKSSIIRRFCEGAYTTDMDTTIGVDFYLSEIDVNGKKVKVSNTINK